MSSRAKRKRLWRAVWARHGWQVLFVRDAIACRCGLQVSGMELVQLGATRARATQYEHLLEAYRTEQRQRPSHKHEARVVTLDATALPKTRPLDEVIDELGRATRLGLLDAAVRSIRKLVRP